MPIIAKNEDRKYERPTPGTVQAVCYAVWDLGLQRTNYQGKEKTQHRAIIAWEINEAMKEPGEYQGKRFVVSKEYTVSLYKSNLLKDLEGWLGKKFGEEKIKRGFDIEKCKGRNCLLGLAVNDKGYPVINSVAGLMPGMTPLVPENNGLVVPTWVQKKIDAQVHHEEQVSHDDFPEPNIDPGYDEASEGNDFP